MRPSLHTPADPAHTPNSCSRPFRSRFHTSQAHFRPASVREKHSRLYCHSERRKALSDDFSFHSRNLTIDTTTFALIVVSSLVSLVSRPFSLPAAGPPWTRVSFAEANDFAQRLHKYFCHCSSIDISSSQNERERRRFSRLPAR
jgi:hypothetical protein